MDHNPYTPPNTEVVEDTPAVSRARPPGVNLALALTGGALLMQFLVQLWDFQQAGFHFGKPLIAAQSVFWFVVGAVLLQQLARGRSWARIMLLIVTLGAFAVTCYFVGFVFRSSPEYTSLFFSGMFLFNRLLPMVMNLVALHLLYFSSGAWFRER